MSDQCLNSQKKHNIQALDCIQEIIQHRNQYLALSITEPSPRDHGDWTIDNLDLINTKSDYFRISLYETEKNKTCFLITQKQQALVLLVVSEIQGTLCALLNIRFEPGLIDNVNYTTTIQSTPNNYLRQHGGKGTPFLELAVNPEKHGCVLLDTENYDWGDLYLSKKKRFLILKLDQATPPPPGFTWVTKNALKRMAAVDHLITNDLRVCIASMDRNEPVRTPANTPAVVPQGLVIKHQFDYETRDADGLHIQFFRTQTSVREVTTWIQPLLAGCPPKQIRFVFKEDKGSKLYAVTQSSQFGLVGKRVWFPADIGNAAPCRSVFTSAEGGRLWRQLIHIQLLKLDREAGNAVNCESEVVWVSEKQLMAMIASPLETSLELRMALSLI
ncbi:NDP-hexose 2,3-dehydratase family protein [Metapseudomonas otitidis]|uniref:NDP-hexose 2,3-dehydratase family protein n=1 Tax=Metapseudomonas otitidis TaxID=319939 RepID=UPI0032169DE9